MKFTPDFPSDHQTHLNSFFLFFTYQKCIPSFSIGLFLSILAACSFNQKSDLTPQYPEQDRLDNYIDWGIYRGDKKANQYAEMGQIHAANVHRLEPVWEYHTGDADENSNMYSNPIIVDGIMYLSTPALNAVALDAVSGEEIWLFESSKYNKGQKVLRGRNRGVTYWEGKEGQRIFLFVRDRVYALDAKTGELIPSFGDGGHIQLTQKLGMDEDKAYIEVTSPGIIFKNLLIIGSKVPEDYHSTPGHVRAYDAVTGELEWVFHTIPQEGQFGHDTWEWVEGEIYGGANPWGGFSLDEKRGWVFFATGSPANDFYGGFRKGNNLFGNCVIALDAKTGERKWHYQTVRHDIYDYDNPPAPILVTLKMNGEQKDAVVQMTKMGLTFILDRDTGEPLFPVEERPIPSSDIPGEASWPTQPFPVKPLPLVRQTLTEADISDVTPESHAYATEQFEKYDLGGIYSPPSLRGTISMPGHLGGMEWGGGAYDPFLNVLYVNANELPSINKLIEVRNKLEDTYSEPIELGAALYSKHCTVCHGADLKGNPPTHPPLLSLSLKDGEIYRTISQGRNLMPGFNHLSDKEVKALVTFLKGDQTQQEKLISGKELKMEDAGKTKFVIDGYKYLRDQYGAPAISPPWGTLSAINLNEGEILWQVPLGEYPELVSKGIRNTGSVNFGGPVTTAGGVVFIAATPDEKIRAFESYSGKILWEYQLPAGGYTIPSIYMIKGKQYLVVTAGGGGKNATKSGDSVIAFALPESSQSASAPIQKKSSDEWISLFDGESLAGWVHLNGFHKFYVEDNAIIGRTVEGSKNSFLCTKEEFGDFELLMEIKIDSITNSGIQIRSSAKSLKHGDHYNESAGRVYGPQIEIRQNHGQEMLTPEGYSPTTGVLYGEALGTGWLSSEKLMKEGHPYYNNQGWNELRILAEGPRIQTWVNGYQIEDHTNEAVFQTHPKGFIGLQVHGVEGKGPFDMKFRNLKIRPITNK
ncbi:family 16 glycoside hydrolase [Pararhodonellum marinum]|uniref:family 16 glycoside hydrolase n=1 Tax=Pararhodonellum marinum TaxID=2755358 RepID=UPI00188E6236|nr:family 16 glycoside hydrolase [Pararhodonellum marinum]